MEGYYCSRNKGRKAWALPQMMCWTLMIPHGGPHYIHGVGGRSVGSMGGWEVEEMGVLICK